MTVVEISVPQREASARAAAAREWLLATGVVVPNPEQHRGPSRFLAGPEVVGRAVDEEVDRDLLNTGVDFITSRMAFDSAMNVTAAACPNCATPLDQGEYMDLLGPWLLTSEPTVACGACGQSALLGNWPGEWTCQVGNVGVRFNNWPPLRKDFVREVGQRLGPRWRVVQAHR